MPVLRHLKVLETTGLGPDGLKAQQELGFFMGELNAQAVKFEGKREALLARRAARAAS
jgi:acyl-[acyl-carrier-protein] desaturase